MVLCGIGPDLEAYQALEFSLRHLVVVTIFELANHIDIIGVVISDGPNNSPQCERALGRNLRLQRTNLRLWSIEPVPD